MANNNIGDPTLQGCTEVTLTETTTPTPVTNYGKVYTKSDNMLYFQDGDGAEHTVFSGVSNTRHLTVQPRGATDANVGNWAVVTINAAQSVHFTFHVPTDFETLSTVKILMIPDATETIQWDALVSVAGVGEAYNNDDRTITDGTLGVTAGQIVEADISSGFTGLVVGDSVGVDFQSDIASLRVIKLLVEYT